METIHPELVRVVSEKLSVDPSVVVPAAKIMGDLGADSLDTVELIMELEDRFGLKIPEAESKRLKTVQDIQEYLEKQGVLTRGA